MANMAVVAVIVVLFATMLMGMFLASETKNGEKMQNIGFAMMNDGKLPEPPKGLSAKERAEWFSQKYDDLPDGAFFALAEEMDIDFAAIDPDNEGTDDHPDVTVKESP